MSKIEGWRLKGERYTFEGDEGEGRRANGMRTTTGPYPTWRGGASRRFIFPCLSAPRSEARS